MPAPPPLLDDDLPLWRLWLDPRGRIGRRDFWLQGIVRLTVLAVLLRLLGEVARLPPLLLDEWISLLLVWPTVAISAKRWHDRDRSAWWVLVMLIPLAGVVWLVADNGFVRGTAGPNRFGPAPRAV